MDRTTFALLEVIYGPLLVLCPHTLLFKILFHARAFRNLNLTLKTKLRKLFISKGCEQLLVPLSWDKATWYLFCKTELVRGVLTSYSLDPADVKDSDVEHAGHFWGEPRLERGVPCPSVPIWKW